MCNVNIMYFIAAVLTCIFISDDFKCGYAKNIFTVRPKKAGYVISKTVTCFIATTCMFVAFFIGSIIGGGISGLSFELNGFSAINLAFCLISKIMLIPVFVSIFTLMSVIAKQKTWLSVCLSLGSGMLLFMMIPMLTPLNATVINVILCTVGGILFAVGLGAISKIILDKTSLV